MDQEFCQNEKDEFVTKNSKRLEKRVEIVNVNIEKPQMDFDTVICCFTVIIVALILALCLR